MLMMHRLKKKYQTNQWFRWLVDGAGFLAVVMLVGLFQTRNHPRGTVSTSSFVEINTRASKSLSSLRGKPSVVYVWAPWCGVCRAQSDNLNRAQRWLASRVNVVSIATAFNEEREVQNALLQLGIDYPVWLNEDRVQAELNVQSFPTLFFLDESGAIVNSSVGYTTTLGIWLRAMLL